jgi:hypothetical protein
MCSDWETTKCTRLLNLQEIWEPFASFMLRMETLYKKISKNCSPKASLDRKGTIFLDPNQWKLKQLIESSLLLSMPMCHFTLSI